jgi:hypothetical protein
MRRRAALPTAFALAAFAVAAGACDDGQPADSGATEPILVHGAQFISGPLPGAEPRDGGTVLLGDGGADAGALKFPALSVTNIGFQNPFVIPGAAGKSFTGRATSDAVAVGIALAGIGSGYWVLPIQSTDPDFAGQSDFGFSADFSASDPAGRRQLLIVALDGNGNAGTQVGSPMCLESRIPDNLHECNKMNAVPKAVFTLQWDTNFDVDLHVIFPDGEDVNPKVPTPTPVSTDPPPLNVPNIDRDSLGSCLPDGLRQEDLVFQDAPQRGTYLLYANPFDACGQATVRFNMIISEPGKDGALHPTFTRSGELLQMQANGGGSTGLFVAEKQYE